MLVVLEKSWKGLLGLMFGLRRCCDPHNVLCLQKTCRDSHENLWTVCWVRALLRQGHAFFRTCDAQTLKLFKYLPHIWILKNSHYSLDPVHGDTLLKAAEACRRTKRGVRRRKTTQNTVTSSDLPVSEHKDFQLLRYSHLSVLKLQKILRSHSSVDSSDPCGGGTFYLHSDYFVHLSMCFLKAHGKIINPAVPAETMGGQCGATVQ